MFQRSNTCIDVLWRASTWLSHASNLLEIPSHFESFFASTLLNLNYVAMLKAMIGLICNMSKIFLGIFYDLNNDSRVTVVSI